MIIASRNNQEMKGASLSSGNVATMRRRRIFEEDMAEDRVNLRLAAGAYLVRIDVLYV